MVFGYGLTQSCVLLPLVWKAKRRRETEKAVVRDLTLHSHSWQLLIVPRSLGFNVHLWCGGKFARVLLGLISSATMKAVICASPSLLARQWLG